MLYVLLHEGSTEKRHYTRSLLLGRVVTVCFPIYNLPLAKLITRTGITDNVIS